jgi:hypothetical protein
MDTPEERTCGQPAFVRYTWPGRDESYACAIHALKLHHVADVMGFHLQMINLTFEEIIEGRTCSQQVEGEDPKA